MKARAVFEGFPHGKAERSHRIDGEFYRVFMVVVIDDTQLFNDKLQAWQDSCNPRSESRPL